MDTQTENEKPHYGQLISVNRKDTTRLLEVYIKRSLSLNDGNLLKERNGRDKPRKWVTMPERYKKIRRHSSDPSIHLASGINDGDLGIFAAVETPTNWPETATDESEKKARKSKKKKKKKKKASLWKSFLGLFSRKGSEEKEEEHESCPETPDVIPSQEASNPPATRLPLPVTPDTSRRRKSLSRKFSKRRRSMRKSSKRDPRKENAVDITGVESVEPTYSYYEKVSEEMEKIVHEVKEKEEVLTDEEVIKRIIALTKQQGDAIDEKLKENPTLCNFFQRMSYTSFQQLADTYLETEMTPTERDHAPVFPTAPELVKLAFTLDFTARVAGLSRQNVGHITGLGARYLEDRFAYQQACTDHPWSANDDAGD